MENYRIGKPWIAEDRDRKWSDIKHLFSPEVRLQIKMSSGRRPDLGSGPPEGVTLPEGLIIP